MEFDRLFQKDIEDDQNYDTVYCEEDALIEAVDPDAFYYPDGTEREFFESYFDEESKDDDDDLDDDKDSDKSKNESSDTEKDKDDKESDDKDEDKDDSDKNVKDESCDDTPRTNRSLEREMDSYVYNDYSSANAPRGDYGDDYDDEDDYDYEDECGSSCGRREECGDNNDDTLYTRFNSRDEATTVDLDAFMNALDENDNDIIDDEEDDKLIDSVKSEYDKKDDDYADANDFVRPEDDPRNVVLPKPKQLTANDKGDISNIKIESTADLDAFMNASNFGIGSNDGIGENDSIGYNHGIYDDDDDPCNEEEMDDDDDLEQMGESFFDFI